MNRWGAVGVCIVLMAAMLFYLPYLSVGWAWRGINTGLQKVALGYRSAPTS